MTGGFREVIGQQGLLEPSEVMQLKLGKNANMGRDGEHILNKKNCKYKGSEAETSNKKGQVSGVW